MKVLITGGAGFIGAHVARALIAKGDEVVLFDDLNSFIYPAALKEARLNHLFDRTSRPRLITGSILNGDLLQTIFKEEKFDKVVHLAAHANPGFSVHQPEPYVLVNELGTLQLLRMAQQHDIVQFIFAGSSSVYNDEQTPFVETASLHPRSPYGISKAAAEMYCSLWHELYNLPITVLRFFSVYGPWGRPDMAPVIFARKIMQGERLEVTTDRKRDFTFIDDVVNGVVLALERRVPYEVINIGRGEPVEIIDLVRALEAASGKTANIKLRTAPPGEMKITYADITKARQLLNYEPTVSVADGAKQLIEWMKHYPEIVQ
jgi:UDP-glucuronate 4-epimerase